MRRLCRIQRQHVFENSNGGFDGRHVGDGETTPLAVLADAHPLRILLQVGHEPAEHRALIIGHVVFTNEEDIHPALLESNFLYAEASGHAAQARDTQKFGGFGWNASEAVLQSFGESPQIEFALDAVELAVEGYSFAFLRHIGGRQQ